MPPLQMVKILGDLAFAARGFQLPVSWRQPSGDPHAEQYGDALEPPDRVAVPALIPPWFQPHNRQRLHQSTCDEVGRAFKEVHDSMLDAVAFAHDMWRLQARFQNIQIMAVCALGAPGCLTGPELESSIKMAPSCAAWTGNRAAYRAAVAAGVSQCFKRWQDGVTVPGLPWYPAFAAFPGPMAPPMPNVPMPLIACISTGMTEILVPNRMGDAMTAAFDSELARNDPDGHHEALFASIALVLSLAFAMWLPMQQVMMVLGKGPIPTFAPPFVPVGPVVAGDIISLPGHLAI